MKTCNICKKKFPATTKYFYSNGGNRIYGNCIECSRKKAKENAKRRMNEKANRISLEEFVKGASNRDTIHNMAKIRDVPVEEIDKTVGKLLKEGWKFKVNIWRLWEEKIIIENIDKMTIAEISKKLNRGYTSVAAKIRQLYRDSRIDNGEEKKIDQWDGKTRVDYGVGNRELKTKLVKGHRYQVPKIYRSSNKQSIESFTGRLDQVTDDLVVLRHKRGFCECFRKVDFLTGELELRKL